MTPTDALLAERERTHGSFATVSFLSQDLRETFREGPNWTRLCPEHREALDMIANKIARILCGDPAHLDHFDDLCGYARLASRASGGDR